MEKTKFSLLRTIRAAAQQVPFEKADSTIIESGIAEMRKANLPYSGHIQLPIENRAVIMATSAGSGKENVGEDKKGLIMPIREALVTVEAGATFLTGLVGDVSIPAYSGSNAKWKNEGVTADDGAGTTTEVLLSPKRLTTFIDVSKQFLAQDSSEAEAMLMADLVEAVAGKLEGTIFGTEAGSATQPAGLFNPEPIDPFIGLANYALIVSLETEVSAFNTTKSLKYITNSKGRGILKSTPKVNNVATFLMEDLSGNMNGYPVLITNHVTSGLRGGTEQGIVFGDWSQLVIGQWGAIDLTVDPFSRAHLGEVRLTINCYVDCKPRIAGAFKAGSIK